LTSHISYISSSSVKNQRRKRKRSKDDTARAENWISGRMFIYKIRKSPFL